MTKIQLMIDTQSLEIYPEKLPPLSSEAVQIFSDIVKAPFPAYTYDDDGRVENAIKVVVKDLTKLGSPQKRWQQIACVILEVAGLAFAAAAGIYAWMNSRMLIPAGGIALGVLLLGVGAYYIQKDEQYSLMKPSVEKFFKECQDYFLLHRDILESETKKLWIEQLDLLNTQAEPEPENLREAAKKAVILADCLENIKFFNDLS